MKLLSIIIEKKLLKFDEDFINNKINFWGLYQAINLASAVQDVKLNSTARNRLWQRVLKNHEKSILLMRTVVYKDRAKAYEFLKALLEETAKQETFGNFWKAGRFAITDYEYGD